MIKSKGIRILCYIVMGITYFLAVILVICGCVALIEEKFGFGIVLILIGIIIPLTVTLSLYSVYALSLIESHTSKLNDNIEQILKLHGNSSNDNCTQTKTPFSSTTAVPAPKPLQPLIPVPPPILPAEEVAINFINKKYNIQIELSDDLNMIKEKISTIEAVDNSVQIFQRRINSTVSFDEALSIIKMHHVVNKSQFVKQ